MPRSTFEIVARIKDQVSRPMRTIIDRFKSFGKTLLAFPLKALRAIFSPGGLLVGGIATLLSFRGFSNVVDGLDEIGKTAERVNATAESLSALKFAGELSAVSFQQLSTAFSQFSRNLENARRGAALQQGAFDLLGIDPSTLQTGGRLDAVEILSQVADGLDRVGDASKRNDILLTLFGRSGANLGPLLAQGREGIRELVQEAEALGVVFSRDQVNRAERFNDAITRLQTTIRGTVSALFVKFEPILTFVLEKIQEIVSAVTAEDIKNGLFSVLIGAAELVDRLADALRTVISLLNQLSGAFGPGGRGFLDLSTSQDALGQELLRIVKQSTSGEGLDGLRPDQIRRARSLQQQIEGRGGGARSGPSLADQLRTLLESFDRSFPDSSASAGGRGPGREIAKGAEEAADAWSEFFEGFKRQANLYVEDAKKAAEQGRRLFSVAAQGIESGLAQSLSLLGEAIAKSRSFGDTWKQIGDVFKQVAKSVVDEVNKIIARLIVARAVSGLGSLFGGGGVSVGTGAGAGAGAGPLPGDAGFIGPVQSQAQVSNALAASGGGAAASQVNTTEINFYNDFHDGRDARRFFLENIDAIAAAVVAKLGTSNDFRTAVRGRGGGV